MAYTKGNWSIGHCNSVVVENTKDKGISSEAEFYGGELIAESIKNKDDAKLIASAPDLLKACELSLNMFYGIGCYDAAEIVKELVKVIKKATI